MLRMSFFVVYFVFISNRNVFVGDPVHINMAGSIWEKFFRMMFLSLLSDWRVCVHCGRHQLQITYLPLGPGGVQFLKRRKPAATHHLCRVNDMLQHALVPGGGSSVTNCGGRGEDELSDGRVDVYHHCL